MVLTQWAEYANTYHKVYEESARKRTDLAEHLRRLPLSFFGRRDLSDLTNAIMKDCSDQERMFMHVMPQLFGTGLSTAIVIVGIFFYDWRLALAAFWVVPAALLVMALTGKHQQRKAQAMEDARLEVADGVQEFLECAQEIRATNRSAAHLDALAAKLDAFERRQVASELTTGVFVTSAQAFLKLGIGTTVFVGATLLVSGQTDFMTYFAFLLVVTRVYDPVNLILQSIGELLSMRLSIRRTQELAAEKPMEGSTDFAPRGHDVVFEDVSFSYGDGEQVLRDVSFTAREGEVTALVGPSGSGKSTVAKLAARFWDADAGSVRVGGVNVADVDPETLLADYAEVFQDVVLFDDTVMGNIRLGRAGATDEEVLAAARAAMCDEFVSRMPQGYDTVIGENGGAHLHRARHPEGRAGGAARRGHGLARRGERDAGATCVVQAAGRQDRAGHRAPHAYRGQRRQDRGTQRGPRRRAGRARRAHGARGRAVPAHGGAADRSFGVVAGFLTPRFFPSAMALGMPSRRETVGTRRARQGCMRRYALPWCEAHSAAWSRAEERM